MRNKRTLVRSALLSLLILSGCAHKAPVKKIVDDPQSDETNKGPIQLNVTKFILPNGLKLIVHENHKLPIFSYYTFFDVGGRHEGPGTTGATHFLEHLMFKGAKKYGPGQFNSLIEGNGGNANAYTNFDNTVYYEDLPTHSGDLNMVAKIVDIESDRMANLALVPEAFEKERNVVLEERKMRYENSPRGQLYLSAMKSSFEGTPYGGSVIGEISDLHSLSREHVQDYFKKFYTPDNATIIIAGDVNADDVYDLVAEYYGDMKPSTKEIQEYRASRDNPELYAHRGRYGRHVKLNGESKNPQFMLAYPSVAITDTHSFILDILGSILGSGQSSYLNKKYVISRKPILSGVSAHNYTLKFNGVFWISGELLPKMSLKLFKKRLIRDLKRSCNEAIDQQTLQKTKNQYLIDYVSEIETNNGTAHFLGMRENFFGDFAFYKKELDIYNSITVEQVKNACHQLFDGDKYIMTSIWERHKK